MGNMLVYACILTDALVHFDFIHDNGDTYLLVKACSGETQDCTALATLFSVC